MEGRVAERRQAAQTDSQRLACWEGGGAGVQEEGEV